MFEALLDQLKDAGTGGDVLPNENLASLLEEAERLVKEMKDRNFTPQKTAAEQERDKAEKRTIFSPYFSNIFVVVGNMSHELLFSIF